MIRILHIMGCSDAGGISSVVLNYYRFLDHSRVHFDIALTIPTVGQNGHALEREGARIYFLPLKSQGLNLFRQALASLLREEHFDGVHVHDNETSYVALQVAKSLGIPCRIAHAHTSSPYEGPVGELRRLSGCLLNYPAATHVIGCGRLAGDRVFGKHNMKRPRALVLPNAVDTETFAFDAEIRQQVRQELGLENSFVLGMVGRLSEEKNDLFPVRLLPELLKIIPNALLVMAGNGPEEENIRREIEKLGLEDRVKLLGRRSDVPRLLQAFDVFLLPSFHEGFPVSAVEALASGLPVLLSHRITRELSFGTAVEYLPLDRPEAWIGSIAKWQQDPDRPERPSQVKDNGFDIRSCAGILQGIYEHDVAAGRP